MATTVGKGVRAAWMVVLLVSGCESDEDFASTGSAVSATAAVLTEHNNNARTGAQLSETILNSSNVNASRFGKLFTRAVDGQLYAQPLYVADVDVPGRGRHNVVYAATEHNTVYAFDADDPSAAAPLWSVNLGPSVPAADVNCGDLAPEIGVTSTPVIDLATSTIYVVAKTKEGAGYFYRLHALDLATGAEKLGGPVIIDGSVAGTGVGQSGGRVAFSSRMQLNRPGLLLTGGAINVAFGSFCDGGSYHGWVFAYRASTLAQMAVYNDTPDGAQGGIWGHALASGDAGDVYFASGNGDFNADTGGGRNLSSSAVRLDATTLAVVDWFTPFNQAELSAGDADFGTAGPLLIPGTSSLLVGDKIGNLYLIDRNRMGRYNATGDTQILQKMSVGRFVQFGSPIYWDSPAGPRLYEWPHRTSLRAYAMQGGRIQPTPVATNAVAAPPFGGALSLSANGSAPGTGIVWALSSPGVLRAFDAADVSRELWNSDQNAARDGLGSFVKFAAPTIAAGKVYAGTSSGALVAYGLLGGGGGSTGGGSADLAASGGVDLGAPSRSDLAVPSDLAPPGDLAAPSTGGGSSGTVFVDEFDRSSLGPSWTVVSGAFSLSGGAAMGTARKSYAIWVGLPDADAPVGATLGPAGSTTTYTGVWARANPTAPSADHYAAYLAPDGRVGLARRNAFIYSYLATGPVLPAGAHTIQLTATGAGPVRLTVTVDGVAVLTATDGSAQALTRAGRAGIFDYDGSSRRFERFTVGLGSTGGGGSSGGGAVDMATSTVDMTTSTVDMTTAGGGATFSDDFTGTSLGPSWLVASGAFSVSGGAAFGTARKSYAVWTGTPSAGAAVGVTLGPSGATTTFAGVIARANPAAPNVDHYAAYIAPDGTVGLARRNNGVYSYLATGPALAAGSHTIQLRATGAGPVSLTVTVDGAVMLTATDGSAQALTGAGRAGIFDYNGASRPLERFTVDP